MVTGFCKLIVMESVYNEALHGDVIVDHDGQLIISTSHHLAEKA